MLYSQFLIFSITLNLPRFCSSIIYHNESFVEHVNIIQAYQFMNRLVDYSMIFDIINQNHILKSTDGGIKMFHEFKKESSYLRTAIFASYKEKCEYCGRNIQQRDMHIDHIIPTNIGRCTDAEINQYLQELEDAGFVRDCIENYLPSCGPCNIEKSNHVYSASNLRHFHEIAKSHTLDILNRINELKSKENEYFYEPIDLASWEILDFSYQRDISHAIMGYRLTPADVEACPRFPQVEKMEKQLAIVDHVVLQGQTGCGKSISVYQTAYDYFKQGWRVYRYKFTDGVSVPRLPQNTEGSLYIIDDAQLLSNRVIEMVSDQARPNRKIIFSKTVADTTQADTISLTNIDAVKILYCDFLRRKDEILPIVHQCDNRIGVNFLDSRIEWRLENAKKAVTPWQFNYALRGGWQSIKEQYQNIASHHNCGMLAVIISAFQIMQLDNAVDYTWLCSWVKNIDPSLCWTDEDLQYLIKKKIVLSEDDVRILHLESAKSILTQHFENCNWNTDKLHIIIEQAFLEKRITPLGLVWLCNGMNGIAWRNIDPWIISAKMIAYALDDISWVSAPDDRMGIAYFMEKVYTMDCEKNGHWYFTKNRKTILDWIEHASSENAYAYSRLINTVYNTDKKEHNDFAASINYVQFFSSLDDEKEPNLFSWGELTNRLTSLFPNRKEFAFADRLQFTIDKLVNNASSKNIVGLSSFLSSIVYLSPGSIHSSVRKLAPVYEAFFTKDMIGGTEIFDFDFLGYICGMSLLEKHRPTKEEQETALAIVKSIPEKAFAKAISTCYPRDWDRVYDIMCLIGKYQGEKTMRIVSLVDIDQITDTAKDSWDNPHDIVHICSALSIGDNKIARKFIEGNRSRIKTMYSPCVVIAPQCAIELFRQGARIDLMTEHWWYYSYYALRELIKVDDASTIEILHTNLSAIVDRLNNISAYDLEESYCLKFIKLLQSFDRNTFYEMVEQIDLSKLEACWQRSYNEFFKKKHTKDRYEQLINLFEQ